MALVKKKDERDRFVRRINAFGSLVRAVTPSILKILAASSGVVLLALEAIKTLFRCQ